MPRWRWLMALLIVLPLAVSRTGTELTPAITIYFMGAYVFGLWLGRDLDARLDLMERSASWIALVAGVSSEERRVGKEGVSTCRSRWSPYHLNKNQTHHSQVLSTN